MSMPRSPPRWRRLLICRRQQVARVGYGRASGIMLKGVSAALRTLEKPPLWMTGEKVFTLSLGLPL